ncbi:hypothetical protein BS78_06G214600 [Paspalum vaginatum]|nr:hypothetical protein BS78_06G214600 [Paspalum vaginatum]
MGSVLSSVRAALCSFVNAQFDKAEERRLLVCFPSLRDLPAQEREEYLRWLMGKEERNCESETCTSEPPAWLRRCGPCRFCARRRGSQLVEAKKDGTAYQIT